ADLGDGEGVREVRTHVHAGTNNKRIDREGFVLRVKLDVVVLDKGSPVRGDHPLGAETDQPTPCRAVQACYVGSGGCEGQSNVVIGVQPGTAALDVNEAAIQNDSAEAAGDGGKPLAFARAGKEVDDGPARGGPLHVHAGDIGLNAEHGPARLPV